MGVYIKDMEMPTSCAVCDWSSYVGNGRAMCLKTSMTEKTDIMSNRRPDWCPLIEVPTPHGRLIDADEMIRIWYGATFEGSVKPLIDARPTVIDAEGATHE